MQLASNEKIVGATPTGGTMNAAPKWCPIKRMVVDTILDNVEVLVDNWRMVYFDITEWTKYDVVAIRFVANLRVSFAAYGAQEHLGDLVIAGSDVALIRNWHVDTVARAWDYSDPQFAKHFISGLVQYAIEIEDRKIGSNAPRC